GPRLRGDVVARLHRAREDARDFLAAVAEIGDDDADPLLPRLQPRACPSGGGFELVLGGWEWRAGERCAHGVGRAFLGGEALEELARLRRHSVERVSHDQCWGFDFW